MSRSYSVYFGFLLLFYLSRPAASQIVLSQKHENTTWIPITRPEQNQRAIEIDDNLYFAVKGGLARWNAQAGRLIIFPLDRQLSLSEITGVEKVKDKIWIITRHSGIFVFDPVSETIGEHLVIGEKIEFGQDGNMRAFPDRYSDALWFGHFLNVDRYDIAKSSWVNLNATMRALGIGQPGSFPEILVLADGVWIINQAHAKGTGKALRCDHSGTSCAIASSLPPPEPEATSYKGCGASARYDIAVCGDEIVKKNGTGWDVVFKSSHPFDYQFNQPDPANSIGPLVACENAAALLALSGSLRLFDSNSMELRNVRNGDGFKLDGHWGTRRIGENLFIYKLYEAADDEEVPPSRYYSFSFKNEELVELSSAPDSAEMQRPPNQCDLTGSLRLEAWGNGLKLYLSSGPTAAQLQRRREQDSAIASMEFFQAPEYREMRNPMGELLAVAGLLSTAESPADELSLLKRVLASKAGANSRSYALCALANRMDLAGEKKDASKILRGLKKILGDEYPAMKSADARARCRGILESAPSLPVDIATRFTRESARGRCAGEYHIKTRLMPQLWILLELKRRVREYFSRAGHVPLKDAYQHMLFLEYVARNLLRDVPNPIARSQERAKEAAEATLALIKDDHDLRDIEPTALQATIAFLEMEKRQLAAVDRSLQSISIYGPNLPVSLAEFRDSAEKQRGSFRFRLDQKNLDCQ